MTITLVVLAVHAVLLLGLPRWRQAGSAGSNVASFITRAVTMPAPAPEPEPQPAEPAAEPPAQTVAAPPPRPATEPTEPTPPRVATPPRRRQTSRASKTATNPAAPSSPGAATGADSLLEARPAVAFGGSVRSPEPIALTLAPEQQEAIGPVMRSIGDAPTQVPRAAELLFDSQGRRGADEFKLPSTLYWRQDGRLYEIDWTLYSPVIGERTWRSTGLLTPQGLAPVQAELRTPAVQATHFDYAGQRLQFLAQQSTAPLAAGAQDPLSVVLQLAALLAADPQRYPVGSAITLPAALADRAGTWRFVVESEETLTALEGKTVPAVHLNRVVTDSDDARIELWLGRTLDHLPVRMRVTEPNGDFVEHNLLSAYAEPTPIAAPTRTEPASGAAAPSN